MNAWADGWDRLIALSKAQQQPAPEPAPEPAQPQPEPTRAKRAKKQGDVRR